MISVEGCELIYNEKRSSKEASRRGLLEANEGEAALSLLARSAHSNKSDRTNESPMHQELTDCGYLG